MKYIFVLWIGFCLGATWQHSRQLPCPYPPDTCTVEELEGVYNAGYIWGLAECAGEEE